MALAEVCRLSSNGRGGYEGFVRSEVRWGKGGRPLIFVPSGTKFRIWQLGADSLDAYLLVGLQPGQEEKEHLLCRLWDMKPKPGYRGALASSLPLKNNWMWELPEDLWFYAYPGDKRGEFVLKIQV